MGRKTTRTEEQLANLAEKKITLLNIKNRKIETRLKILLGSEILTNAKNNADELYFLNSIIFSIKKRAESNGATVQELNNAKFLESIDITAL